MRFPNDRILPLLIALNIRIAECGGRLCPAQINDRRFSDYVLVRTRLPFRIHAKRSHRLRIRVQHLLRYAIICDLVLIIVASQVGNACASQIRRCQLRRPHALAAKRQIDATDPRRRIVFIVHICCNRACLRRPQLQGHIARAVRRAKVVSLVAVQLIEHSPSDSSLYRFSGIGHTQRRIIQIKACGHLDSCSALDRHLLNRHSSAEFIG
ncbi:hypothetical protein D3C78_861790 [compost metagenome]